MFKVTLARVSFPLLFGPFADSAEPRHLAERVC